MESYYADIKKVKVKLYLSIVINLVLLIFVIVAFITASCDESD